MAHRQGSGLLRRPAAKLLLLALLVMAADAGSAAPSEKAVAAYEAGMAAKKAGDMREAYRQLQAACSAKEPYPEAEFALGWVQTGRGHRVNAAGWLLAALSHGLEAGPASEAESAVVRLLPGVTELL